MIVFEKEEKMKEFMESCKPGSCPLEETSNCDSNCDQCEAKKNLDSEVK